MISPLCSLGSHFGKPGRWSSSFPSRLRRTFERRTKEGKEPEGGEEPTSTASGSVLNSGKDPLSAPATNTSRWYLAKHGVVRAGKSSLFISSSGGRGFSWWGRGLGRRPGELKSQKCLLFGAEMELYSLTVSWRESKQVRRVGKRESKRRDVRGSGGLTNASDPQAGLRIALVVGGAQSQKKLMRGSS